MFRFPFKAATMSTDSAMFNLPRIIVILTLLRTDMMI